MTRDGHIRVLPVHVANKIAAGEVVERPASVLKELLENAVDAGARRIDITVTAGGRKLVSVRDDGCGMTREDALLSLERQATSKIRDVDDIEHIDTLGFRGEAVPSIASVSRFTLVTRRADSDSGTRIIVNAGTVAEVAECGAPPGTTVEVRDLFCNVPARQKFLRSYATEEGHIRDVFTVQALAHPEIGFSLTLDGRELYRLAPGATLEQRIASLFGADIAERLLRIPDRPDGDGGTSVHGYIAKPNAAQVTRAVQYVFVNGRPATAPTIAYALKESYPRSREDSRPVIFLFIEVPPAQVDVNVHPAKREVRFRRPTDVKLAIVEAITAAINPAAPAAISARPVTMRNDEHIAPSPSPAPSGPVSPVSIPKPAPVQFTLPVQAKPAPDPAKPEAPVEQAAPQSAAEPLQTAAGPWRTFRYLTQTESGYLLIETDDGIVTINPVAARERISYEKVLSRDPVSQPLLLPETVKFPPLESARLRNFRSILEGIGFALDDFGNDTWKIDAVPALLEGADATATLQSIVYDISEQGARKGGDRWREELVARSVARAYAGASCRLTENGAVKLVEELSACRMPYVCPRGRPVMIFTSNRDLERRFSR